MLRAGEIGFVEFALALLKADLRPSVENQGDTLPQHGEVFPAKPQILFCKVTADRDDGIADGLI